MALRKLVVDGYGSLLECITKTPYSFSTDPLLCGAPPNHVLNVRGVPLAAGAEFDIPICGDITTMPGLPHKSAAKRIDIDDNGGVVGLF